MKYKMHPNMKAKIEDYKKRKVKPLSLKRVVIPPSYAALRKDYKRQIMREFMDGTSTLSICRKHSLTKAVVEQIIRSQMRKVQ